MSTNRAQHFQGKGRRDSAGLVARKWGPRFDRRAGRFSVAAGFFYLPVGHLIYPAGVSRLGEAEERRPVQIAVLQPSRYDEYVACVHLGAVGERAGTRSRWCDSAFSLVIRFASAATSGSSDVPPFSPWSRRTMGAMKRPSPPRGSNENATSAYDARFPGTYSTLFACTSHAVMGTPRAATSRILRYMRAVEAHSRGGDSRLP